MFAAVSAIGGGIPLGPATLASGAGEGMAPVVHQETALVRSVDLRTRNAGDGDAWAVLLFGSVLFLVALGFLIAWLRGRFRRSAAVAVSLRPATTPPATPSDREQLDPYPA